MPHLPFHPAPGLSDLAPGWFVVPQNPLTMGKSTPLVATTAATAPGRWIRNPTLADLVQGAFVVPQNPVANNLAQGLASLRGLGCGCNGGCGSGQNFYAMNSLGDLGQVVGTDPVSQFLAGTGTFGTQLADETTVFGFTLPLWGWVVGGGLALYAVSDLFSKGHAASKRLAGRYAQNPRRRANESISQGFWRGGIFHPIRAADDYDPGAVGEARQYATKKKRKRSRK